MPSLVGRIPLDDMMKMRRLPRHLAEEYIKRFDLTPEELLEAEKLFREKEPPDTRKDSRLWVAVAWLLGASYRMIAKDKGVTAQTIFAQVSQMLPDDRVQRRLGYAISLEAMSEYKVSFFENLDMLRDLKDPDLMAMWLLASVDLDHE